jgi:parallel beta-helix repeat protein
MRIRRSWQVAVLAAAAVTMLVLASGGAARSATTYTVGTSAQLNTALAAAVSGDTIVIKPGTYFTVDATTAADGFSNANGGVMITGKTDLNGKCTKTSTTILDGDFKPTVGPGHTGVVFTVGGNTTKFQCFTMRFGTAGIVSDGWSGLNVKTMAFVGNGRDLDQNTNNWDGDGIYVLNGDSVLIKKSTFSGMGRDAIESDAIVVNSGWVIQQNAIKNVHGSCIGASVNINTQVGQLVGTVASNGNTCTNVAQAHDAIIVGFGPTTTGNIIAGNTVTNATGWHCFDIEGDGSKFVLNTCTAAHDDDAVYLNGDNILSDRLTVGPAQGHCLLSDGDDQTITNTKCGAANGDGIVVNGDGTTVTNASVKQANGTCLQANGDNQVWTTASCTHATGGTSDGLYSQSNGGSFTGITIGDVGLYCFYVNDSNETLKTTTCHSAGGSAYFLNDANLTVDGFDALASNNVCVDALTGYTNVTIKNGHCGSTATGNAVQSDQDPTLVDKVVVDSASGACFDLAGDNTSLTSSTGRNCATAGSGQGIYWSGVGTAVITGNVIKQSYGESLLVDGVAGGNFTINNNAFRNSLNAACVDVSTPDTLVMTGNSAIDCNSSGFKVSADTNPKVNTNTEGNASFDWAMQVVCNTTCGGAQVNSNILDGTGDGSGGLFVTNNGTAGLTISGNTITNMSGFGLEVVGSAATTLTNNTVLNSSDTDDLFGIWLNSDGNTLTGSTVSGGYDNGIEVAGDNNIVNNNLNVTLNGEDGIHIAGTADATSLTGNHTTNNAGEGLEDDGTNTTWTNNTSSGNRQDCAGTDATFVNGGGNSCADGTFFDDPGSILAPARQHKKK